MSFDNGAFDGDRFERSIAAVAHVKWQDAPAGGNGVAVQTVPKGFKAKNSVNGFVHEPEIMPVAKPQIDATIFSSLAHFDSGLCDYFKGSLELTNAWRRRTMAREFAGEAP